MTLELKHLVGYLPYGLKCRVKGYDDFEVDGVSLATKKISQSDCLDSYDLELTFKVSECKPILRPLSDLTKEIDGVVHLVELAEIQCECDILDYKLQSKVIGGISTFGINYINDDYGSMVFGYDTFNGFGLHIKPMNDILFVSNQLKLYEYLFKNHFDVYGLIEKGLAIDVNTIENV